MNDNQKVADSNISDITPNRFQPRVVELNMDDILPNRFQPRITFGEDAINELATSIKEHGVIQPIVVRKINDKFEIIAGERRYKASKIASKRTIPAIITDLNDKESAEIALIENVQREDLTPIEEAVSYKKILDMGYLTQEELSAKLGKKQSTISNKLRLLNLDEEVQEALLEKKISERHARSLLKLNNKDQKSMLKKIIEQRLTVRKTDEEIEKILGKSVEKKETVKEEPIKELEKVKEEKIEILDLEEKGDKTMNNDIYQGFNIPSDPIIEAGNNQSGMTQNTTIPAFQNPMPQQNVQQPAGLTQNVVPEMPSVAPGFMDVDKIATTASDINIEKPAAPVEDLLKSTTPVTPVAPTPQSEIPQMNNPFNINVNDNSNGNNESQGKFFGLNEMSIGQDVTTSNPVSNEQSVTPQVTPNENVFGTNVEPQNSNFIRNIEEKETNVDFGIPTPSFDNTNLNFDSFYQNGVQNNVQQPTPSMNPQNVAPVQPEQAPSFTIPTEPVITPQPAVTPMNMMNPVMPQVQPTSIPTPTVQNNVQQPTPSMNPQNVAPVPNYTVPTAAELDAYLSTVDSSTPMPNGMPANNVVPPVVQAAPTVDKAKVDQVVSIMKETKEKINALGISVDLDEFDFDDMYQAIFKIDK